MYTRDEILSSSTTLLAGTNTSSPLLSSKIYNSSKLKVHLSSIKLEVTSDCQYVGTAPRSQVENAFNLIKNNIRFRIDRGI